MLVYGLSVNRNIFICKKTRQWLSVQVLPSARQVPITHDKLSTCSSHSSNEVNYTALQNLHSCHYSRCVNWSRSTQLHTLDSCDVGTSLPTNTMDNGKFPALLHNLSNTVLTDCTIQHDLDNKTLLPILRHYVHKLVKFPISSFSASGLSTSQCSSCSPSLITLMLNYVTNPTLFTTVHNHTNRNKIASGVVPMYIQFIEAFFTSRMSSFFRTSVNNNLVYAHMKSVAFPLPIFMKLTNTQHNVQIYTRFHELAQEVWGIWIFTSLSKVLLSLCLILHRSDKNV